MVMDKIRQSSKGGNGFCLEAFRLFKPPKSVEILPDQFKKSLERLLCTEFTEAESRGLFDRYDSDKSGSLDIQEFISALLAPPDLPKKVNNTRGMVFGKPTEKPEKKEYVDLPLHGRIQRPWIPKKWHNIRKLKH